MVYYDVHDIKQKLCILEIFTRDGHQTKKSGAEHYCLCPFHTEKTPSCHISVTKQFFHCFGCHSGGDLIRYWQLSRSCDFKQALADLASIAGVSNSATTATPQVVSPPKQPQPRPPLPTPAPLDKQQLRRWIADTERLAQSESDIRRIAEWRGFSPALIRWAAHQRIMGLSFYGDTMREAFIVRAPCQKSNVFQATSLHIRLAPHTCLNDRPQQSWRYSPKGRGTWPLIIGNPSTATKIFLTEGQWDALALCELLQLYRSPQTPDNIAIIALRGAGANSKLLLSQYHLNPSATLIAFLHSDEAGNSWLNPGALLDQLSKKVSRIAAYLPDSAGSDLNQRLKEGLTWHKLIKAKAFYSNPSNNSPTLASLLYGTP